MVGRPESFVSTIGVSEDVGVHHAAVQTALHGNSLAPGNCQAIFTAWSGIDQGTTASVLHDELVAEDLGDNPLDRDGTSLSHLVDRRGLQQHHASRLPILGEPRSACAKGGAGDQHDRESARYKPAA
jgi:hypothetical protein